MWGRRSSLFAAVAEDVELARLAATAARQTIKPAGPSAHAPRPSSLARPRDEGSLGMRHGQQARTCQGAIRDVLRRHAIGA